MQPVISSGSAGCVGSNVLLFLGPDPGISEAVGEPLAPFSMGAPRLKQHRACTQPSPGHVQVSKAVWESLSPNLAVLFPSQRSFPLAWYQFSSCLPAPFSPPAPSPAVYTLPSPAKHFTSVQGWMHIHRKQNREILSKMQTHTHTRLLDSSGQVQCSCSSSLSCTAARHRDSDGTALQSHSKILTEWKS